MADSTAQRSKFRFSIDRGGTFTDIYAEIPQEPGFVVTKLLSEDPSNYKDAPTEGIRRILEQDIEWIRMGTTVATNALLERKGERTLLLTTRGFRDLLKIGNQTRPRIFDLQIEKPELLYERVIEVDERVKLLKRDPTADEIASGKFHRGVTGEWIEVEHAPDLNGELRQQLEAARKDGFNSVAVVFLHSYTFHEHEKQVGTLCEQLGFKQVSVSSLLTPMIKVVQRGHTATVDAYLTPLIKKYIEGFSAGFDDQFATNVDVSFMMSDGGLCPMDQFNGYRSILSGPAGGVVGYARTSFDGGKPVIGIDMGGTSTDVSRFGGTYEHVFETQTAGVFIQAPQLAIETVAAGGGSRLFFKNGMFVVGPESAGAHPGPVCYRKNGYLAITDANVQLGRVVPEYFPKIFGANEDQPLGRDQVSAEFEKLTVQVNAFYREAFEADVRAGIKNPAAGDTPTQLSPDEVAFGFVKVANEAMCRPIRSITEAKGFNVSDHVLSVFGGAGPQHACNIARQLGMRTVFVHRFCSILSAYGLGLADIVVESQEPCSAVYGAPGVEKNVTERLDRLSQEVRAKLEARGFAADAIEVKRYLNLRYAGTDTQSMTEEPAEEEEDKNFLAAFERNYKREYGFILQKRGVQIDDVRVRAIGKTSYSTTQAQAAAKNKPRRAAGEKPKPHSVTSVYFEDGGRQETPVFLLSDLVADDVIQGPALIIDKTTTTVIIPGCTATITSLGDIRIDVGLAGAGTRNRIGTELDPIQLSVFAHRFMSIAEQMGTSLERTAVSTNIKERLDFSCAIFGPDGALVANAPHLPVHLGSMQEAVRWQIKNAHDWKEGEVIASNHPAAGGSHLPDITVIAPVYKDGKAVFYVANRGHHADIGGIAPGSMPPFSTKLIEEGACFKSFKLVENGTFQESGITELLMAPGQVKRERWETPSSGTRNLSDNISDLKAQIASNNKGILLIQELINYYGLDVVQAYMKYIQQAAESAVRDMLRSLSAAQGMAEVDSVIAEDFMDNGAAIRLKLTIDRRDGSAIFDFTGTDAEIHGNINAPTSVTKSAIIYALRCMVKQEIPLNQGCLDPITIILPKGSLLDPSDEAAVVGGNVLTSQRVTDVILTAFKAIACSQGCMNNFTFGDETMGYYETIAGGAGAGPTWKGQDAVQVHMTNTRITDAEILEKRYPIILRQFSIRYGSGGRGEHDGGNGVVREFEFQKPLTVGILSERRVLAPPGICGGGPAARGRNILIRKGGKEVFIGPKAMFHVDKGDRFRIETPGGGGYGKPL